MNHSLADLIGELVPLIADENLNIGVNHGIGNLNMSISARHRQILMSG